MVRMVIESASGNTAVINTAGVAKYSGASALDFVLYIEKEYNCREIIMNKSAVTEEFFDLSTGIAGEVAQKLVNYGYRIAIVGDFSVYDSKSLHDSIFESNNGKNLYFAADEDEAVERLRSGGQQ